MFMRILSALLLCGCILSCQERKQSFTDKQKEIETGKLDPQNIYSVKEIGWTVQLPEGWEVMTRKELQAITDKGKKEMEKTFDTKIDNSGVQQLLSLRKDRFNSFLSNMQKFDSSEDGTYEERLLTMNEIIRTTYRSKNMKLEDKVGATRIGGVMFDVLDIKIFTPDDGKKVLLYQSIYSAFINGYDFTMNINYNNNETKELLLRMVNSSKFTSP
jgi:hypothetical protein